MEPVAVLVLYTLTEESNFRHKLYSWITVSPGRMVKKKKSTFQSLSVPRAGEWNGVWFGAMAQTSVQEGPTPCAASLVGSTLLSRHRA